MISRIVPIILFLISIGLFVGYINPVYTSKIIPLQDEIKKYNNTLAAAADFNRKEQQLASERNAIPADAIHHLETYLPDGVDNVQLILDLNALAARSGIQLSNFEIRTNTPGDVPLAANGQLPLESSAKPTDSLDLSVKATGSYTSFRAFLDGIEKSLRPMDLTQMTITNSPTGVYSYDMTFRIYWLH